MASKTLQTLLDFDLGESSSDSDFQIDNHSDDSRSSGGSDVSDSDQSGSDDSDDDDKDSDDEDDDENAAVNMLGSDNKRTKSKINGCENGLTAEALSSVGKTKDAFEKENAKILSVAICSACLGDRSDDANEIVVCDSCQISVHEMCYGITDSASVSSTVSSCSTEPWFCEACKANVVDPSCELCPNKGGIFKETDVGKWVHLVCALYVPGVAFGEVDQLSSVTLFEMPYSKWGAKTCSLCDDERFARCGVCIGCDAGMCKTYFHVTCAQAHGLLSETHSEEADHADPFYAHCKIHSDKALIKRRKRNYNTLRLQMNYNATQMQQKLTEASSPGQQRIERKLKKHRHKYVANKHVKNEPWVPTQKMPRLLTTSASACRRLMLKAEQMGINTAALEFQETQMATLADVRKKWHIPPAFSVEFVGYYIDRISRLKEIKQSLQEQLDSNATLTSEQEKLRTKYDEAIRLRTIESEQKTQLIESVEQIHAIIRALCPTKSLPSSENIAKTPTKVTKVPETTPPARVMSVPTAAALKMGVGFPLTNLPGISDDTNRVLSTQCPQQQQQTPPPIKPTELLNECGICKQVTDQHCLVQCDTCHLFFHLGCLTPPLTRHPKKSKIYGWQCSECDEDNPDGVVPMATGPRKSRTKYSKDGTIVPVEPLLATTPPVEESPIKENKIDNYTSISTSPVKNEIKTLVKIKSPIQSDASLSDSGKAKAEKSKGRKNKKKTENKGEETKQPAEEKIEKVEAPPKAKKTEKTEKVEKVEKSEKVEKVEKSEKAEKAGKAERTEKSEKKQNTEKPPEKVEKREKADKSEKSGKSNKKSDTENRTPKRKNSTAGNSINTNESLNTSQESLSPSPKKPRSKPKKTKKLADLSELDSIIDSVIAKNTVPEPAIDPVPLPEAPIISELPKAEVIETKITPAETKIEPPSTATEGQNGIDAVLHKQNRKRRKEKHRSKDRSERSSSKEHKKKRKRKNHDEEKPILSMNTDGVPKIKIKFKAMPAHPGEVAAEPQCFYVPANMVRPREYRRTRPASVNHNENVSTTGVTIASPPRVPIQTQNSNETLPISLPQSIRTRRLSVLMSPSKMLQNKRSSTPMTASSVSADDSSSGPLVCDVCHLSGTASDLVKCDECQKNYHFGCLEPPLKKTPKRRGYSWHCADCDPTDNEGH